MALLVVGPPWLLWIAFGNPVDVWSSWWNTGPFAATTAASSAAGLRVLLIWAGWLVWAALAILLVGSVAGVLRGRRLARWRLPMPLHRLIVGLTGTATVAVVTGPAAAAVAAPVAHSVPASVPERAAFSNVVGSVSGPSATVQGNAGNAETPLVHEGRIMLAVGRDRYEHHVRRGDTLSKIAKTWLRDADRWPDICKLNKHRHVARGQTLTDCDLIYPGWTVRLPADAVPPADATPSHPHRPPGRSAPPVPARPESTNPPVAKQAPTTGSPDAEGPGSTRSAPPSASNADDDSSHPPTGGDLVLPGGSIIPWTLAVAITATAALVWLQRRRRYVPGSSEQLHDLPAPLLAAQHHTRHASAPALREPEDSETLPSGGVGLIGSSADAAARGLLITAITAGTPTDPAQRAEVIIDRPTLTELLGDPPIAGWPRLHITDTLEQALTLLDTHLLRRARILDEHNLTDLDTLRETTPAEEALPPLLLITHSEQATDSTRARITFGLTQELNITTVVLGHWPHGPTLSVSDDGDARLETSADHAMQLAVLDIATTRDLLDAAREAHTGQPPAPSTRTPTPPSTGSDPRTGTTVPVAGGRADKAAVDNTPPLTPVTTKRARLRVLGEPGIEDITADGRPLRAKALELAVYLAVHPDGASTREIGEYLEPDARISQADQRVHTNASNLRHVLGRAGTADTRNSYLIKTAGRYRLDPATVDVDLWNLRDLLRQATIASQPRRQELLTAACNLCTAPLAEGQDYEWIQPHRETVRRWSTEAHLSLADDLLDSDPQAASDLLDKAIGLDRYNEALYTKAMHARHALGDADGIRTLLRALTKALADLNAEPREDTIELARHLRNSLTRA
ncbi:LysM peptidoglycan-binding domain-containing protein [Couchioplanes caeruleus]|uniref:LysM peptidoglycan-binding domain-containing protein n=1 Tax=Couchioplanes caeruleus TaxID=56438 RepID=UPI0020BF6029|nr:LysM peptidoglycan-binding domain-containing protein [Couchioplanes caeruleus]UQU66786.1 LysM peptidoglycan-binding domain-containing protein [Couchioplanes caeruleus]